MTGRHEHGCPCAQEIMTGSYMGSKDNIMPDEDWKALKIRLGKSPFRSRFHLKDKDLAYAVEKGLVVLKEHADDFVSGRIAPAFPAKDGKQTPMRGHPVFVAQHATATCCRSCIRKWHGIPEGKELSPSEKDYIVSVLMRWMGDELKGEQTVK